MTCLPMPVNDKCENRVQEIIGSPVSVESISQGYISTSNDNSLSPVGRSQKETNKIDVVIVRNNQVFQMIHTIIHLRINMLPGNPPYLASNPLRKKSLMPDFFFFDFADSFRFRV